MLDLLRHGLPLGAAPFPAWLRERAQEILMQHLRCLRRGDTAAPQLSQQRAAAWLESMPPVYGGHTTAGMLCEWFDSLGPALVWQAERELVTPEKWLESLGEGWQQLGTLCFHLAENAGEGAESHPFAFLATFIHRAGQDGKPRHAPLALARQLYANDADSLAALLRPLQQAQMVKQLLTLLLSAI
jgi:non-specific serine/threonine protein kinase